MSRLIDYAREAITSALALIRAADSVDSVESLESWRDGARAVENQLTDTLRAIDDSAEKAQEEN